MFQRPRRRIVACVDGTWYDADGREGQGHGNNSNVYRIFATIDRGMVVNDNGQLVEQITEYFQGIGTNESLLEKFNSGITGAGCAEQIARVYKYCCRYIQSPQDELWFYGFSRGAYVVTAVAALLDRIGALIYDESFDTIYEAALNLQKVTQKSQVMENSGKLHYQSVKSRKCPPIKFLGLLDTVKRVNKDLDSTMPPLTFHGSVGHVRHALALNETRTHFKPETYDHISDSDSLQGRSLIQAWFVGAHADIGGAARCDGLSLYPLQWMLIESQHQGLILQRKPRTAPMEDPQALVFPSQKRSMPREEGNTADDMWKYEYANGIKVEMRDLRLSHNQGNTQTPANSATKEGPGLDSINKPRTTSDAALSIGTPTAIVGDVRHKNGWFLRALSGRKKAMDNYLSPENPSAPQTLDKIVESDASVLMRHSIRLNPGFPYVAFQSYRTPFRNGKLEDSSQSKHGCFGNIIHPSVYFIMDLYAHNGIESALKRFEKDINRFRDEQHFNMRDPWLSLEMPAVPQPEVKACRILVCGRTGVGKSTLINKVFGVPMTIESHMKRGDHNINEAFESDKFPGIVIHDSLGFEAGDIAPMDQFESFIKNRSAIDDTKENLHAIWICMQTDTDRVIQTSEAQVFKILAKYAAHIPIIIVGTKKDNFLDRQEYTARGTLAQTVPNSADLDKQSRILAEEDFQLRQLAFRNELERLSVLGTDPVQIVHVSRYDEDSIRSLVSQTLDLISNEDARLKYTAAQVIDGKGKVNQAVEESIRLLRHGVWASSLGAAQQTRTSTISKMLCDKVLKCFGFRNLDTNSVENIMNDNIGWNLIRFLAQQVGQSVTVGGSMAILTFFSLVEGEPLPLHTSLLEAAPAARMIIKYACDLILILGRAYNRSGKSATSTDVEIASREYVTESPGSGKSKRKEAHAQVMKLMPVTPRTSWNSVRISKIRIGMKEIIQNNRWKSGRAIAGSGSMTESMVRRLSSESLKDEVETNNMFEVGKE